MVSCRVQQSCWLLRKLKSLMKYWKKVCSLNEHLKTKLIKVIPYSSLLYNQCSRRRLPLLPFFPPKRRTWAQKERKRQTAQARKNTKKVRRQNAGSLALNLFLLNFRQVVYVTLSFCLTSLITESIPFTCRH